LCIDYAMAGRPSSINENTIPLLKEAFLWGCTDAEACVYADVSTSAFYRHQEENPGFRELKETLKTSPVMRAKRIVSQSLDKDELSTAHKVIERKEGLKVSLEGDLNLKVSKWDVEGLNAGG
jgi:hypothetical protein